MIPQEILKKYNAFIKQFQKGEIIFSENDHARYYYQIISGVVKMSNFNDEGKEFIQGIFYKQQSFGEPPLFIDVVYPANAITLADSELLMIAKSDFLRILTDHTDIHLDFTANLAKRLYYKAIIASEISSHEPSHRILRFFDYLKEEAKHQNDAPNFKIIHTRQQISDILGLRVETVIRTIKQLEKQGEVIIRKGKVYR